MKDNIDTGSSKSCEYFKGWMEFVAQCESEELSRLEWAGRSVKKKWRVKLGGIFKAGFLSMSHVYSVIISRNNNDASEKNAAMTCCH